MNQFDGAVTLWTCVRTVLGSNLPSCELRYSALKKGTTAVNSNPDLLFLMILPAHPTPHNLCSETALCVSNLRWHNFETTVTYNLNGTTFIHCTGLCLVLYVSTYIIRTLHITVK
jgi:hypothetical protein